LNKINFFLSFSFLFNDRIPEASKTEPHHQYWEHPFVDRVVLLLLLLTNEKTKNKNNNKNKTKKQKTKTH